MSRNRKEQKITSTVGSRSLKKLRDMKVAFPMLEELVISHMDKLMMIWNNELSSASFGEIKIMKVEYCEKLLNIFPSSLVTKFQQIEELTISDCGSLEEVYNLQTWKMKEICSLEASQLRKLSLFRLPKLKHIWNGDPQGILSFQHLYAVRVDECDSLKNVFPASVAKALVELEKLNIESCESLDEIVARDEGVDAAVTFVFPKLTSLKFCYLPELKNLHSGKHNSEWPLLKKVNVCDCEKMEVFGSESVSFPESPSRVQVRQPLFLVEKVIPNLEKVALNSQETMMIWKGQFRKDLLHKVKHLVLHDFDGESPTFPLGFFQRLPNIEKLELNDSSFKEILSCEGLGEVEYKFEILSQLLQNLEHLELCRCSSLIHLVPSSVCFMNLTYLDVAECHGLINLLTSSTARSLVQLKTMIITDCRLMQEVIASEGDEALDIKVIVFNQLAFIQLDTLPNLASFCSQKHLKFPALDEIVVYHCSRMEIFSGGVVDTPQLEKVYMTPDMDDKWLWEENLNDTIKQLFVDSGKHVKLSESPELQEIWQGQLPASDASFWDIKILEMEKCEFLSNGVIPSNLLQLFNNLEMLGVRNCQSLEIAFDSDGVDGNEDVEMLSRLSKLYLIDLPMLRQVWTSDAHRIMGFKNLKVLKVENCGRLTNVLTPSVAICLVHLEEMEIKNCTMMEAIITEEVTSEVETSEKEINEEAGEEETNNEDLTEEETSEEEVITEILLPQLNSIILDCLPNLVSFYVGNGTLHCPNLKKISIVSCAKVQRFSSSLLTDEPDTIIEQHRCPGNEESPHTPLVPSLFHDKVAFPMLEELVISRMDKLMMIWNNQSSSSFGEIKIMKVEYCEKLLNIFPFNLVTKFRQIEELTISNCESIEEIVARDEGVDAVVSFVFPQLTSLKLWYLPKLKNLYPGKHYSGWPLLREVEVYYCEKMEVFSSESVSFKEIHCEGPSRVQVCQPLFLVEKVIPNLETLSLNSQETMMIWTGQFRKDLLHKVKCLRLYSFNGESHTFPLGFFQRLPNIKKLQLYSSSFKEILSCEGLEELENNFEILGQLLQNLDHLEVWECSSLKLLVPSSVCFMNLTYLYTNACHGLINLLTSSTSRSLVQLRTMVIMDCREMQEVIATKGDEASDMKEIVFSQLSLIQLDTLPNLASFCSQNHVFKFPALDTIIVHQCSSMKIFSGGVVDTPQLKKVYMTPDMDDKSLWEENLNATIKQLFVESVEHVKLLESPELQEIWQGRQGQLPASYRSFLNLKILEMEKCEFLSNCVIPSNLLYLFNNLEMLDVRNCQSLEVAFDSDGIDIDEDVEMLSKLSKFYLNDLPMLRQVWTVDAHRNLGFKNLKVIKVESCGRLRNLLTPSMAICLVHLEEIEIKNCTMMEAIITEEVTSEEEAITEILLPQLNSIILDSLPNLISFYVGNGILQCSNLKRISILSCVKVQAFSSSLLRDDPESIDEERDEETPHTPSVPSLFSDKLVVPTLEELFISHMDSLMMIWHEKLAFGSFYELKIMKVEYCGKLHTVFPSNLAASFRRIETLTVSDCESLQEVYDLQKQEGNDTGALEVTQLRILNLFRLPKLKYLWNEDPQRILSFQHLRLVHVEKCSLTHLFPTSVAKDLMELENLTMVECRALEEIVAKDEGLNTGVSFEFPQLTSLKLWNLPELKNLYSGKHSSEWPLLKKIDVFHCEKLEVFLCESVSFEDLQPLFLVEKVIPNLEELTLTCKDTMMISHGEFPEDLLHKVKFLYLQCFHEKSSTFPSSFFQRMPNIENLHLKCSSYEEIFPAIGHCEVENHFGLVPRLKELKLQNLHMLNHIWKDDSMLGSILQNLQRLEVWRCSSLKLFVPSPVCFINMTFLDIFKCDRLVNLLTTSTAKTLVQLKTMWVRECRMMQEIISTEGDEAYIEDIVFDQLSYVRLENLSNLACFCSRNHILHFPSLNNLLIHQCPKLKIFSEGVLETPMLQKVRTTPAVYNKWFWEENLNATIKRLFAELEKKGESSSLEM